MEKASKKGESFGMTGRVHSKLGKSSKLSLKTGLEEGHKGQIKPPSFFESGWGDISKRAYSSPQPSENPKISSSDQMIQRATEGKANALDEGIRGNLEYYFGTRLDQVKVGEGSASREAADRMGAYAFTYGQTIHMGSAGMKLSEPQKNALLAHEVTHTLQQRGTQPDVQPKSFEKAAKHSPYESEANQAGNEFSFSQWSGKGIRSRVKPTLLAAPLIQASEDLKTNWGEFDFESLPLTAANSAAKGAQFGVEALIKFTPGENVDAKKIGFIQAVYAKINNSLDHELKVKELQATSGSGIGYQIDQTPTNQNPVYTAENHSLVTMPNVLNKVQVDDGGIIPGGDRDRMSDYKSESIDTLGPQEKIDLERNTGVKGRTRVGGVWGQYYFDSPGLRHEPKVPATMIDSPTLDNYKNSIIKFETAALCAEGNPGITPGVNQEGTYYGSLEWGFQRDENNAYKPIPPRVIQPGIPSLDFLTAAKMWNESTMLDRGEMTPPGHPTNKYDQTGRAIGTVLPKTRVSGNNDPQHHVVINNEAYKWCTISSTPRDFGLLKIKDLVPIQPINAPLPVYSVFNEGVLLKNEGEPDIQLPIGTRLMKVGEGEFQVAEGPETGRRGKLNETDLKMAELGTR